MDRAKPQHEALVKTITDALGRLASEKLTEHETGYIIITKIFGCKSKSYYHSNIPKDFIAQFLKEFAEVFEETDTILKEIKESLSEADK